MQIAALPTLLQCLQSYAEQQSNPVLDVLQGQTPVQQQRQYPDPPLSLNADQWRVFYHCHRDEFRFTGEHGHFHLFHRLNREQWSHVAGLCMDEQGQALRWFTVNHWVCGGQWCVAEELIAILADVSIDPKAATLEQWLMSMLALYQDELKQLIWARDNYLQRAGAEAGAIMNDRKHYLLSESSVDLLSKIKSIMQ